MHGYLSVCAGVLRQYQTCRDIRLAGVPKRISSLSQQVDTFVKNCGGNAPMYSILVANNGIAAVKFIRSIRKWAFATFGSDKAISLVAMATHEDIKSNAEHIHMADQFVEVPGGGSAENYGNVQLIAQIASQAAVDAVWPGWYAPQQTIHTVGTKINKLQPQEFINTATQHRLTGSQA